MRILVRGPPNPQESWVGGLPITLALGGVDRGKLVSSGFIKRS